MSEHLIAEQPVAAGVSDTTALVVWTLFYMATGTNLFYAVSRWTNLIQALIASRCFTDNPKDSDNVGRISPGEEPPVTIQICTYNEGAVVEETIRRACSVDWPQNKLTVQVLDDSTDSASCAVVQKAVAKWREKLGVNVSRLTRPERLGYKAGSLRYHFAAVESDFVAHFDADHHMEPDFLRRAVPHFFDKEGNEMMKIGVVQAPWGYYNMHQNFLTEAEALSLDRHHVIEQTARAYAYNVFGFNGTGGIWRKSAVRDAGGWTWDSVTEDVSLSYHAFVAGYKHVYIRDIPQPLELPGNLLAYTQQKNRWTKGFFQVFRQSYWNILRSTKVSKVVKWEAFCHLTSSVQFFTCIVLQLVFPVMQLYDLDTVWSICLMTFPVLEPVLSTVLTCFVKVPGRGRGEYRTLLHRSYRLCFVPFKFAIIMGLGLFESASIAEGLISNDATFLTTPKAGLSAQSGSANPVKRKDVDDWVAVLGILLGIVRWMFLFHPLSTVNTARGKCIAFGHLGCGLVFLLVNGAFLAEKYKWNTVALWKVFSIPKKLLD